MINAKGQVIYTNAEIAYELGISPSTVNACAKRLLALHEAIQEIMGDSSLNDVEVRKSVDKGIHLKEEIPEGGI